jgi:hypothetical protein
MDKLSAKIENWAVVDNLIFHGFRKLEPGQRLTGYLMGHSDLPNGVIYTAVIQSVDQANGLVETANSVYRLGQGERVLPAVGRSAERRAPAGARLQLRARRAPSRSRLCGFDPCLPARLKQDFSLPQPSSPYGAEG